MSTGLREHFNPKARWKAAIASAREVQRLNNLGRRSTTKSSSSGGWNNTVDSSDDELSPSLQTQAASSALPTVDPGANDFVHVTPPHGAQDATMSPNAEVGAVKREDHAAVPAPLQEKVPSALETDDEQPMFPEQALQDEPESTVDGQELDEELRMPGSFDSTPSAHNGHVNGHSWMDIFKNLQLK